MVWNSTKIAMPVRTPKLASSLRRNISIPEEALADFCRRNHIARCALFGSVLREDFRADSDVDVLVEYMPGHIPGFAFVTHEDELSAVLGRKVDLNTPNSLSRHFRERVLAEAEEIYVRA